MLVQIFEKQEEMKAKKAYQKSLSKITDLDDICTIIEDLIERVNNVDFGAKESFAKEMRAWEDDFISEMKFYEDENLEISEMYEKEMEEW